MFGSTTISQPVNPLLQEDLTPKEYLQLLQESPGIIKETKIIPPKLGGRDFGRIRVRYRYPYYGRILSRLKTHGEPRATF